MAGQGSKARTDTARNGTDGTDEDAGRLLGALGPGAPCVGCRVAPTGSSRRRAHLAEVWETHLA